MALDVSIAPVGGDEATGFSLDGVFSLPDESGALPEADLVYTQRADGAEVEGRFIANGETVFVEVDGQRTELPPGEVEAFRVAGTEGGDSVFGSLEVDGWFPDPKTEKSGDEVTLSGDLDVVAVLNDIFEVSRSFGASMAPIEGSEAETVADSVRSATGVLTAGADDGLLRGVTIEIDFGVADPDISKALGPFAGARFTLSLDLARVNEPVDVE